MSPTPRRRASDTALREAGIEPSKVVVNGAAIALLDRLISNLRDEVIRRFDEHEARHARTDRQARAEHAKFEAWAQADHDAFRKQLRELEDDDRADDDAVALAKARRDGQLSWVRWIHGNKAWLVPLLTTLGGALVGILAGKGAATGL